MKDEQQYKFRYPLNLQHFGGTEDDDSQNDDLDLEEDGVEIDDQLFEDDESEDEQDDQDDTEDSSDKTNDQIDDEDDNQEQQKGDNKKGKEHKVPVSALQAERQKWQKKLEEANKKASIAEKLMKQSGISDIETFQAQLDAFEAQNLVKQGISPEVAQAIVTKERKVIELETRLRKTEFDGEVSKLKLIPLYADIEDYRDEVEDIAIRTGASLKQAYLSIRGEDRMQELEKEMEYRMKSNKSQKENMKVDTSNSGEKDAKSSGTKKSNLSADELAVAKMAVKMGVFKSVEEYAKEYNKGKK